MIGRKTDNKSLYEQLGGEKAIRELVENFYINMDTLEEAKVIRAMHPKDLSTSVEKLYEFLVGWSGGPPLYTDKYGHPRLRMRHLPFAIGGDERDQWMLCMNKALEKSSIDDKLKEKLSSQLWNIADFMRNKEE